MTSYTNKSTTTFYQAPSTIATWQGICPTDQPNEYLVTGTQEGAIGALYKGPANIASDAIINNINYPNATSTSVYGPEYISDNKINLVGSYQVGTVGVIYPCFGFGYSGSLTDIDNKNNYFTIEPIEQYKYTVVHSIRAGLAVYISSDLSQLNFNIGKSFIYDIDKKETIADVLYPNSTYTTTYGIWYNGQIKNFDFYTISGGFSITGSPLDTRIFVVDFYYNRYTNKMYFENWTELKIPEITLYTHAQGISGLSEDVYVLPIANFYLESPNDITLSTMSGGKMQIKRVNGTFIVVKYDSINFPQAKLTIVTSAAENAVVGVGINSSNTAFSFEAITKK